MSRYARRGGLTSRCSYLLKPVFQVVLVGSLLVLSNRPVSASGRVGRWMSRVSEVACQLHGGTLCVSGAISRTEIGTSMARYSLDVAVGPGATIGIHRIVTERVPWVPVHSPTAVFMVHGDIWDFNAAFASSIGSAVVPEEHSLAVYLAQHGIDVWGIDLRWTNVPEGTSDLSFMSDWNFNTDTADVAIGLSIARAVRLLTGGGFAKIHLLGWSRSAQLGYMYLARESQLPSWARQVKGFIPVDVYLKTDDEDLRQAACQRYTSLKALLDSGVSHLDTGVLVRTLGELLQNAPGDPSPIFAGLSNRQAALLFGEATSLLFAPDPAPAPWYHFSGGTFDTSGLPAGLTFTDEAYYAEYLQGAAPYQPLNIGVETEALICDDLDLPHDDHLGAIDVPLLYVNAAGGFSHLGLYTTTLTASTDITSLEVSLLPPGQAGSDFGHADLFVSNDADILIWNGILDWLLIH